MHHIVVLVLLCLCGLVSSDKNIPDLWSRRRAAAQMLVSTEKQIEGGFLPPLGNGFIGADAGVTADPLCIQPTDNVTDPFFAFSGCGRVNIGGVFNTMYNVPRRASIPNTHSVYVKNAIALVGTALDLEKGLFHNRSVIKCQDGSTAEIEVQQYMHREFAHLQVLTVKVYLDTNQTQSTDCNVEIGTVILSEAVDYYEETVSDTATLMVVVNPEADHSTYQQKKKQKQGEQQTKETTATAVGVARQEVPSKIVFNTNHTSVSFYNVYVATIENQTFTSENVAKYADAELALYEKSYTPAKLLSSHQQAWVKLWESGIEIEGNLTVAASVNSSLYYLLSSVRADGVSMGISPGGIARGDYNGHSFWDGETWMLPVLTVLYPTLAKTLTQYRIDRLPAALEIAETAGNKGAKWPWESAWSGYPVSPWTEGDEYEIHIGGDIVNAFSTYRYATGDDEWWSTTAWPVVEETANYYADRGVYQFDDPALGNFTFKSVICPDEKAGVQDDNPYTNAIAARTMQLALNTYKAANGTLNPNWVSDPYLPVVDGIHPEYTGYNGSAVNQADVALLQYPLDYPMNDQVARNDLKYYEARSSGPETKGYYTGDSAYSIAWLMLGDRNAADKQFQLAFEHMDQHFNVWIEKSKGSEGYPGNLNFLTGAGGYLQNILFGYMGLFVNDDYSISVNPALPPGCTAVKLRKLRMSNRTLDVEYTADTVTTTLLEGDDVLVVVTPGQRETLTAVVENPYYDRNSVTWDLTFFKIRP